MADRTILNILAHLKRFNWLKAQYLKAKISWDFPIDLHIEPTNLCNLDCSFCASPQNKEAKKGYMDMALYKKIIDECAASGKVMLLLLHKDGESLLHSGLPEMIRYAKEKKAAKIIHLSTNGLELDKNKSRLLIESGLDDILIALDAARRSTYLRIKGVDRLEEVEDNIMHFVEARKAINGKRPFIRVKMIRTEKNSAEVPLFKRKWERVVDKVDIAQVTDWPQFDINNNLKHTSKRRYACPILWYSPAINWDGKVSICCMDGDKRRIIGDVSEKSLHEIWRGDDMRKVRRAHLEGKYEICGNCSTWSLAPDLGSWLKQRESVK
ncbi:MAG: SPASM domain-containing protein [Candidatus Omnitrophica bacterium]|nr:SPASM domain-containing protein [Candidatus Omnitrophota bacterium]